MHFRTWIAGVMLCAGGGFGADNAPKGYKLLYEQTFDKPEAIQQFEFTDPKAWKYAREENGGALELAIQSKYNPAVRSPLNIALLKEKTFGDFVLEADLMQTSKEYGHRDMCLFFGFQDPSHFYYVHMATAADPHAHNIFLVNDAPRTNIATMTTKGVNWGQQIWHKVRLERKIGDGSVKVYFDDMTLPIMTAHDKSFGAGFIGFGSFDDTGKVDNIKIWAPEPGPDKPPIHFQSQPPPR
jgi:hypothetical protein